MCYAKIATAGKPFDSIFVACLVDDAIVFEVVSSHVHSLVNQTISATVIHMTRSPVSHFSLRAHWLHICDTLDPRRDQRVYPARRIVLRLKQHVLFFMYHPGAGEKE